MPQFGARSLLGRDKRVRWILQSWDQVDWWRKFETLCQYVDVSLAARDLLQRVALCSAGCLHLCATLNTTHCLATVVYIYIYIYSPLVCKDWRVYSSCYVHSLCKPIVKPDVEWDCNNVRLVHRHLLSVFVVGVLDVGWCAWTYVCLGWTNYRNVIVVSSTTTIKTDNGFPVPGAGFLADMTDVDDVLQFGK